MIITTQNFEMASLAKVGGKAFSLIELSQLNFNIPNFMILTTEYFDDFINRNQINLKSLLGRLNHDNIKEISEIICDDISKAKLCDEIKKQITQFISKDKKYSVRSSAADEDGSQDSFAGILESFLFKSDINEIEKSIIQCYQSCFTYRALQYRLQRKIDISHIKMAVVIQEMVEAEKAGVLFTANPTNGSRKEFVISANNGVGEGVVNGDCETDEYIFNLQSSQFDSYIKEKDFYYIQDSHGSKRVEVPKELVNQSVLSKDEIIDLCKLARTIVTLKQIPQDIEWAIKDNNIYLLQSRAITSLRPPQDKTEPIHYFDNSNIQESFCGVTTPLTFSYANEAYFRVYHQLLEVLGLSHTEIQKHEKRHWNMIAFIQGRVYYNINSWYEGLKLFPSFKSNKEDMESMMGLEHPIDLVEDSNLSLIEKIKLLPTLIKCYGKLILSFVKIDSIVSDFESHFKNEYAYFKRDEFTFMSLSELFELTDRIIERITTHWKAPIINDFYVMTFHGQALRFLKKYHFENPEITLSNLLAGEPGIQSTAPTKYLLKISDLIKKSGSDFDVLSQQEASKWKKYIHTNLPEVAKEIENYISLYGDRVVGELKLETKSLHQDDSFLYEYLKSYTEQDLSYQKYIENESKLRAQTEKEVFSEIKTKIGNKKLKRFKSLLIKTRKGVKYRENLRLLRTRTFGLSRSIYLEMGRQFKTYKILNEAEDIFYLTRDELERYRVGRSIQTDLLALVESRKLEYAKYHKTSPAHHFQTKGLVCLGNDFQDQHKNENNTDLKGIGCYPGIVNAEVYLTDNPQNAQEMKGKILCTMRTDPGWAPVFPLIKGLVVERGSLLSHSAVIAREMGIPTIVSIPGITSKLKHGERIEIDGESGTIQLVDRSL